jgi:hypothetical protein
MLKRLFGSKPSADKPGFYQGKHYTEHIDRVKALKRADKLDKAEQLLLALIDVIEAENQTQQFGVAPWYYEQLAILYRGRKDYAAEVAILERYQQQLHSRGEPAFAERLAIARALRDKTT